MTDPAQPDAALVLVVEDEWLIADLIEEELVAAGYRVAGPVPSVAAAMAILASRAVDVAILDVNLGGERSAPVARLLASRGVPFVYLTGYSDTAKPGGDSPLEAAAVRIHKPFGNGAVAAALRFVLQ